MKVEEAIKKGILDIILEHLSGQNCVIFLFGSFARGKSGRGSKTPPTS